MKQIINDFYTAFQKLDAEAMAVCYHDEIVFEDPAFGVLKGEKARNMWRMLCNNTQNLQIKFSIIDGNNQKATAYWEARYTFSKTNRKVLNKIHAHFSFKDGKISQHTDCFNLHNWAKQALGLKGYLLGGTFFFKKRLNQQTNRLLLKFENQKQY